VGQRIVQTPPGDLRSPAYCQTRKFERGTRRVFARLSQDDALGAEQKTMNNEITMRRGYRPSLVVTLAALAIVVGMGLKSYTREQRIGSMAPAPSAIEAGFELAAEN
jgi:hypothetical protein